MKALNKFINPPNAEEHTEILNAFLGKPHQLKGLRETISRVLSAPAGNNGQLNTTN